MTSRAVNHRRFNNADASRASAEPCDGSPRARTTLIRNSSRARTDIHPARMYVCVCVWMCTEKTIHVRVLQKLLSLRAGRIDAASEKSIAFVRGRASWGSIIELSGNDTVN